MYNNGIDSKFIKKQAFLAIFVFWFCACLVLYTVNKTFFEYDYSKVRDYGTSTNNVAFLNSHSEAKRVFIKSYEFVSSGVAIIYGKVASFTQIMFKEIVKKPSFFTTSTILLLPYLLAFLIILSLSTYLSAMRIVSASCLSSFIISFTIIFDAFAGNENIDFIISYSAPQVSAYATINLIFFFLISFPFCFYKKAE
ncbi:MAG: hypothetical protein SFT90_02560 [Rickettsiales bacterium]|nr:hypothetical protein [Rickettsiales bacterium]